MAIRGRHGGDAALEEHRLVDGAGEVGHLAVERTGGLPADRSAAAADAVDDLAVLHRDRRGEGAAELEQHEGRLTRHDRPRRSAWSWIAERGGAELVGRTEVDPVDLAMLRDGIEVNDAGQQDQGQPGVRERAGEQAEAADAALFTLPRQEREPEIVIAGLGGRGAAACRSPRGRPPGRARRVIERSAAKPAGSASASAVGHERSITTRPPDKPAHVDGDRTGVDADDPRHRA